MKLSKKISITLLILTLLHLILPIFLSIKHAEDYSITFNGAKLILDGFVPYVDFGVPTGLGNYLSSIVGFKLFGLSYKSMYYIQIIEHLIIIYFSLQILNILDNRDFFLKFIVLLILYNIHLVNKVKAPFYNSEFLIYEILSLFFIIRYIGDRKFIQLILSTFFCFLTIQVKQDFGFFNFFILSILLFRFALLNNNYSVLFQFLLTFLFCWIFFFFLIDMNSFIYWFRLGSSHQPKISIGEKIDYLLFKDVKFYIYILLVLVLIVLWRIKPLLSNEKNLLIIVLLLLVQNIFTLILSNFPYLNYSLPLSLAFIFSLLYKYFKNYLVFAVLSFLIISPIVWDDVKFGKNFYSTKSSYVNSCFKALGSTKVKKDDNSNYFKIKLRLNSLSNEFNRKIVLFNATSMPFHEEAFTTTPRKLPLWFDEDVILYPKEKELISRMISKGELDAVIVEHVPGFSGYKWYDTFLTERLNKKYILCEKFFLVKYQKNRFINFWISKDLLSKLNIVQSGIE